MLRRIAVDWVTRFQKKPLSERRTITIDPLEAFEAGFDYAFHQVFLKLWDEDRDQLDAMQALARRLKDER